MTPTGGTRLPSLRLLCVCLSLGCGARTSTPAASAPTSPTPPRPAAAAAAPAAPSSTRKLPQDETVTTASGTSFTAPKGWYLTTGADLTLLEDPDRELKLALVEISAADRDAAVAGAWARFQPGFKLAVARAVDLPAYTFAPIAKKK